MHKLFNNGYCNWLATNLADQLQTEDLKFDQHTSLTSRLPTNKQDYVDYMLKLLHNQVAMTYVEPYANSSNLVRIIKENNYTFITHNRIIELNSYPSQLFQLLFQKWENGSIAVLDNVSALLLLIKENFSNDNEEEKIAKAFVFAVFKVINKLINYLYF
jgi:hypothetical protein